MNSSKDTHQHDDDIGCLEAIEAFYAYLDGELDDPQSIADFEHHMSHCRSCFSRAEVENMLTPSGTRAWLPMQSEQPAISSRAPMA